MKKCSDNRKAVSLVEIMIVVIVMGIISLAIYSIISRARYTYSKTEARANARQDASTIMRYLERDVTTSRSFVDPDDPQKVVKTLEVNGSNLTMSVPLKELDEDATYFDANIDLENADYHEIKYELNGTDFIRIVENGPTRTLSKFVKEFEVDERYDGKISVRVLVEYKVRGYEEFETHEDHAIFTVREASQTETDKRWRQRVDSY